MNLKTLLNQDTVSAAQQLLGWELTYESNLGLVGGIITETEAYTQDDPASHTYMGKKTNRNAPMFNSPGHIYIYFIYGMYHCINIVCEPAGTGAAILIRELSPTVGIVAIKKNRPKIKQNNQLLNGPAKLMMGLGIPNSLNNQSILDKNCPIKLIPPKQIITYDCLPRIGISKAMDRKWRFKLNIGSPSKI